MNNVDVIDKLLCVYHFPCPDGFSAAWVVREALGEENVEFVPMNYGQPYDIEMFRDRAVYLVDFSFKAKEMLAICDIADNVLVIDHHKTAEAELSGLMHDKLMTIFDMDHSGAVLTWNYFFAAQGIATTSGKVNGIDVPLFLKYIEDRDLWKWKLPASREICMAISSYDYTFENWSMLDAMCGLDLYKLELEGRTLKRQFDKTLRAMLKETMYMGDFAGHHVPIANVPYAYASDAGNLMCDGPMSKAPFSVTYYDTANGFRKYSLRSTDAGLDVSEIAKMYGGGGHRNAAGFSLMLPTRTRDTFA
jgi:oligoribonuclease NrnB/cAMP/cGMP phosphodiesterase (DHH superfamily)